MAALRKTLVNAPADLAGLSIEDFWSWAFSDLSDDDLKGIFAEWLVVCLLGHKSVRRVSWANSDIILKDGLRVEVKATAFWQSWKFVGEDGVVKSKADWFRMCNDRGIKFSGLRSRNSLGVIHPKEAPRYKSDLYVFCLEHEKDVERLNPLDLSQWEFYIVTRKDLELLNSSSISLRKLHGLQRPISAQEFRQAFQETVTRFKGAAPQPRS